MSTMEKLLVQIFQRKNQIIDQVQAQIDLFDQHHASKLLIEGIDPPSWLRKPTVAHSRPFDPSDMTTEDLISDIIRSRPQFGIPFSSNCCSVYEEPVPAAPCEELPNGVLPDVSSPQDRAEEMADSSPKGNVPESLISSLKRKPLAEIFEIPNSSASGAVPYADRFSTDLVNTEFSFSGTHDRPKRKLGNQKSSQIRYNNKESQTPTVGANGVKWATESSYNRSKRPKLAGKTSLREGGSSLSKMEQPKRKNIVSSSTSFIPLVQQKQAAVALPVKRDIKVKALEAAEAAKRLAEKKENERKTKKEALKIERARREKENLRQLELQKTKKEEERKKKGADMAAKKRRREEEEKKEKERKRLCLEEARKQHKEHEQKLHAQKQGKDKKFRNTVNNLEKTIENKSFSANTIPEQSYDISPYKESEDKDKEEDNKPNNKPVPLWASKINVALAREYQNQMELENIFPPEVSCNIAEVFLPRKYQL